ncbi:M24 family metallopeptidase [Propionispora hippei]|uniref:Xaa-Pro aminopeptidase n=1 Tax=Propionispora hippei DSM 15287 TaxID=1123003 RepID=A0A1M6NIR9_9FIRM|nr:Xaa-Pro peptidase family protein [Propionispora hippei]SHJ95553.1 Xaa-Pro aminopeptidase [Propionispora hippei DSM 15287]
MGYRLEQIRKTLSQSGLDGILITKPENRRYVSGFTGSAGLVLISQNSAKLFTDFRYTEQATKQAVDYEVIRHGATQETNLQVMLAKTVEEEQLRKIGFESDFVTFQAYTTLKKNLPHCTLEPIELDHLRMVKDEAEIRLIQKAVDIADAAFTHILSFLKPGITEYEVALEIEHKMRQLGAEKPAFDTIVASGIRGSLPHAMPLPNKMLTYGEFVTMDFGAVYQGYSSDITRTVVLGKANTKQQELYNLVLKAQLAGVQAVSPGKVCSEVDYAARGIIEQAGYGEFFGHGLGHGVGLAIHEEPRLSPSNETMELVSGMVVTVEPGVYLPDWGGLRIEDTVLVSAEGSKVLTASSKLLIELE